MTTETRTENKIKCARCGMSAPARTAKMVDTPERGANRALKLGPYCSTCSSIVATEVATNGFPTRNRDDRRTLEELLAACRAICVRGWPDPRDIEDLEALVTTIDGRAPQR